LWLQLSAWSDKILPSRLHLVRLHREDASFQQLYREVRSRTLVDELRCFMLVQFACSVRELEGNVAEVGVYRGGTAKLISRVFGGSGKDVHLFDTFQGIPSTASSLDRHRAWDFGDSSVDEVSSYLRDCPGIHIHPGLFPATARGLMEDQFCFVHV